MGKHSRLAVVALLIAIIGALLFLGQARVHSETMQQTLDRMDRDVAAAKAAAGRAEVSADEAKDAARRAWNGLPGSS